MDEIESGLSEKQVFIEGFKRRTRDFVVRSIRLFQAFPKTEEARILGKQFLRSASSTGATYRARSKAEFYAKLSITIEEADESLFWMEIITESGVLPTERLESLMQETTEILKILSKARKNT